MKKIFIINAGNAFGIFWSFIKIFVDKNTQKKVNVLSKKENPKLFNYVDKNNLPEFLGGNCKMKI